MTTLVMYIFLITSILFFTSVALASPPTCDLGYVIFVQVPSGTSVSEPPTSEFYCNFQNYWGERERAPT